MDVHPFCIDTDEKSDIEKRERERYNGIKHEGIFFCKEKNKEINHSISFFSTAVFKIFMYLPKYVARFEISKIRFFKLKSPKVALVDLAKIFFIDLMIFNLKYYMEVIQKLKSNFL